jgi:RimJ/RimL family protein N-acetyltransferase
MHVLNPIQAAPVVRSLFDPDQPAGIRSAAVFEGNMPGRILTDHPVRPTWAVLQESVYGTIYLAGTVPASTLAQLIADLRREGEVMVGLWPDDARVEQFLRLHPEYDGTVFDFWDRPMGDGLDGYLNPIPEGCMIRRVDAELFRRLADYNPQTAETVFANGIGFCLMRGEEILCEAFAARLTQDVLEMGVLTHKPYEGRGYAALTCAHLVRACESAGFQTYWNCNAQNRASVAIARKLGYRIEKPYRLLYWPQSQP